MNAHRAAAALLAVLTGTAALAGCSSDEPAQTSGGATTIPVTLRFDGATGTPPDGWRVGTTSAAPGGQDARWELRADPAARSPPNVLALVDARGHAGEAFNLIWTPEVSLADIDVEVAVHAGGGSEDQGGGPAWRIADADDYYVVRWNPLEDNVRVYSVVGGNRVQLDGATVHADSGAWHTLRARQLGVYITCWFDGRELLHARDDKLSAPGAIGLWTKADATTAFDDLVLSPLP